MSSDFGPPRQLLPKDAYYDAAWYAKELDALFAKAWVWAATEGQLAAAGDFVTCRVLHHPLFIVRDADGEQRVEFLRVPSGVVVGVFRQQLPRRAEIAVHVPHFTVSYCAVGTATQWASEAGRQVFSGNACPMSS